MAETGTMPAGTASGSLSPFQVVVKPRLLRLQPVSQPTGNSASISSRLWPHWRSIRVSGRGFTLARPTTPARRLGWRRRIIGGRRRVRGLWLGLGFFTPVDLGCVAGDVAEDVAVQSIADEVLMNPLGQVLRGEFAEGAGERPFAGDIAAPLPPANAAERAVDVQALDQRRGGGMLSTALATKARAICGRSSAGRPRPRPGGAT